MGNFETVFDGLVLLEKEKKSYRKTAALRRNLPHIWLEEIPETENLREPPRGVSAFCDVTRGTISSVA